MINLVKTARILIAILFVFSGISKLISLSFFDGLVAELLLGPEYYNSPTELIWVQIFTRVLISIELTLGVAILQNWKVKSLILPAIQLMLVVFTIHLFYEGFTNGFGGNCGCFGDVLPLSNAESIVKNVVAILLGIYIRRNYKKDKIRSHFPSWVIGVTLGLVTFGTLLFGVKDYTPEEVIDTPIIENPLVELVAVDTVPVIDTMVLDTTVDKVQVIEPKQVEKKDTAGANKNTDPTPKDAISSKSEKILSLMEKFKKSYNGSFPNFRKGTHLVGMFSMTCSHCQEVIQDFCLVGQEGQLPKQFLFNFGSKMEQNYFFGKAAGCDYPHVRTENYVEFTKLLGGNDFPRILVIKDGEIVKDWNVKTYSITALRNHFGIKEKVAPVDPLNPIKKDEEKKTKLPWE